MKIFVTLFVASTFTVATADVSLKSGYIYNSNSYTPSTYYMQQPYQMQYQQPQYPIQNIIPNTFPEPSTQYLPLTQTPYQPQTQLQQHQPNQLHKVMQKPQQEQQQSKEFAMQFPMPSDFPAMFNFQPAFNAKPTQRYRPRTRILKKPIVTKHFYIHSAPEETQDEIDEELSTLEQQPRQHYNVLFVKTPSQTNKATVLSLAKALKKEKTVVYVLAKKSSVADLQDSIHDSYQHISKPEVFFIKYRTPEEAANAQRHIQSQYDSLDGSTTITDEGVAPATSVIGSLDASEEQPEDEEVQQNQLLENSQEQMQVQDPRMVNSLLSSNNNAYLPPLSP